MNDDAAEAAIEMADFCDCTDTQPGRGETCSLASCPSTPGRKRTLLHPRLDVRAGRPVPSQPYSAPGTASGEGIDPDLLRGFLKRVMADDILTDDVDDLLFDHVVVGRYHPSLIAAELPRAVNEILYAASHEDWQAVADDLIAAAREVEGAPEPAPLRFIDYHRQRYAETADPIAEAGEFIIGSYHEEGGDDRRLRRARAEA